MRTKKGIRIQVVVSGYWRMVARGAGRSCWCVLGQSPMGSGCLGCGGRGRAVVGRMERREGEGQGGWGGRRDETRRDEAALGWAGLGLTFARERVGQAGRRPQGCRSMWPVDARRPPQACWRAHRRWLVGVWAPGHGQGGHASARGAQRRWSNATCEALEASRVGRVGDAAAGRQTTRVARGQCGVGAKLVWLAVHSRQASAVLTRRTLRTSIQTIARAMLSGSAEPRAAQPEPPRRAQAGPRRSACTRLASTLPPSTCPQRPQPNNRLLPSPRRGVSIPGHLPHHGGHAPPPSPGSSSMRDGVSSVAHRPSTASH